MTVTESAPPQFSERRISRIVIGPRANRDMGDLEPLKTSIAADGLIHPVIVTPAGHLVLGPRRLQACKELGWTDIRTMTVTGIWQALRYLETELRDPRYLKPLSPLEAMGMDSALRELEWWPKQPSVRGGNPDRDPNLGNDRRRDIAILLGMNSGQYVKLRELWQAVQGYKETIGRRHPVDTETQRLAAVLLPTIQEKGDITPAFAKFRGERPLRSASPAADGRHIPQRGQAKTIEHGLASVAGSMHALARVGPIDPSIPAELLYRWEEEAGDLVRQLNAFRRKLREQGNDDDD